MANGNTSDVRPGEESYIQDFNKAKHVAYAEKPFRDEALLLDKMADENYQHLAQLNTTDMGMLTKETPKEATDRGDLATRVWTKMTHLNLAADISRRQARYMGDQAQKQYNADQE